MGLISGDTRRCSYIRVDHTPLVLAACLHPAQAERPRGERHVRLGVGELM